MLKQALLLAALTASAQAAPSLVKEDGIRLSSAALQGSAMISGTEHYFFIRDSTSVYSATTADGGLSFTDDPGIRLSTSSQPQLAISSITGLSILPLSGGGFRMLYSAISTNSAGNFIYNVFSATSADGLSWANDPGARISGGAGFVGFPTMVNVGGSQWRFYYTGNIDGGTSAAKRRLFTALSNNQGRDFAAGSQLAFWNSQVAAAAAIQRTDGRVRLYLAAPTLAASTTDSAIWSALATDANGTVFATEGGAPRLTTDSLSGFLSFPFVERSTDSWRWRLYYNYTPFLAGTSTADVVSASAYAPDPAAMSPNTVLRTASAVSFAISGESFDPGPSLQLKQGAASIAATGIVTRNSDQSLTASFNMNGQALGFWDLVATNSNGFTGTLSKAVFVDFAPGTVRLTDNLMRPRLGTRTRVDVMTFNDGPLAVKLYTLSGELVKTLYDASAPQGTTTIFWDGTTGLGHSVASGVYFLRTVGQKVNSGEKIVVIK